MSGNLRAEDYDWRCYAVDKLAKDVPPSSAGATGHKAGSAVAVSIVARTKQGEIVGFVAPSAVALAVNIARRAADQAEALRAQLVQIDNISPWGHSKSVADESLPQLFDYFERCLTVATFSFQALETFANDFIRRLLQDGTYPYKTRKNKVEAWTAEKLERQASTKRKLGEVVPKLLGIGSPENKPVWTNFAALNEVRDATIHIKAQDQHGLIRSERDLESQTLFHRFMHDDISEWPRNAVAMLAYYRHAIVNLPWYTRLLRDFGFETD